MSEPSGETRPTETHRGQRATIRIAAAVIQDQRGRLLLVRKAGTTAFMQPGGKIERDEAPETCLRRELREELGLDASEADLIALGTFSAPAANEAGCRVEAVLYRTSIHSQPVAAAEIAEIIWFDTATPPDNAELAPLTGDIVVPMVRAANWPARL